MIKLQILGVNGHNSTNSLTHNTIDAIEQLGIIVKLEEVNDIDEFIKYDLEGIPALAINGQLAFQQMIPNVADLVETISALIQPIQKRA